MSFSNHVSLQHLLLLIPVIITVVVAVLFMDKKRRLVVISRLLSILLIISFLLGLQIDFNAKDTMTIFVVDMSASTGYNTDEIEAFIKAAIKEQPTSDAVGIITFGQNVSVNNVPSEVVHFTGFDTVVNEHFTDISGALIYAEAMFEPGYRKRIVLITDGYENMGDVTKILKKMPDSDTGLGIKYVNLGDFAEVLVTDVFVPKDTSEGQNLDVSVEIYANVATNATIKVYANEEVTFSQEVSLIEGTNHFVYGDRVDDMGLITYTIEVIPDRDTFSQNNRYSTFTKVSDKPNILMVKDDMAKGDYLETIMSAYAHIDVMHTDNLVENTESLIGYDGFVLVDVSAEHLSDDFMLHLQELVQYQGKGLLVTGGDNSYGPGGYFDTPLETILPVEMTVVPKEETPNLGLVLVIDKSGSMTSGQYGVSKLELAKEAAIRGTDVLEENDQLGVIAFDDTVKWVIEMTQVTDKVALQDEIATIVPGGGTTIKPSLEAAVEALVDTDTKLKHIILLTDGQAEQYGYDTVLQDMQEHDITISTVAVGMGSDQQLLRMLADEGGGRYYLTDEFSNIPTIFAKEAFLAGEKYLNYVTFTPAYVDYSEIMSGINAMPYLDGYVSTKIKDTSKLILMAPDEKPILATWQYGLGRTVSWTADVDGLWSTNWLNQSTGAQVFHNIFAWMIQEDMSLNYDVSTSYDDGKGHIVISGETLMAYQEPSIETNMLSPDGSTQTLTMEATAPGRYEAYFEPDEEGIYLVDGSFNVSGEEHVLSAGVMVGYSPEYDFKNSNPITADKMALLSGGTIIEDARQVFDVPVKAISSHIDLSRICLWLALIIFLFELVIRKTNLLYKTSHYLNERMKVHAQKRALNKQKAPEAANSYASDLVNKKRGRRS